MENINQEVKLDSFLKEDSLKLFQWINDKELVRYNAIYKPIHEITHNEWFKKISNNQNGIIFGIKLTNDNCLIGSCQLFDLHPVFRTAELQIRIGDKEYKSKGYGTIALNMLLDYGFKNLNLNRIFLQVFGDNIRAIKSYNKVGFVTEGTLRQAAFIEGEYKDIVFMGILKDEFYGSK